MADIAYMKFFFNVVIDEIFSRHPYAAPGATFKLLKIRGKMESSYHSLWMKCAKTGAISHPGELTEYFKYETFPPI